MKFLYTVLLLEMIGLLYVPSSLSASKTTNEIFYAQNQLTAHLKEENLKEVLLAVAKMAKVEFTINKAIADRKVSVQFYKLPLEKGIKKILRPFNHSMIFYSSGWLKTVIILESGSKSSLETISEDNNFSLSIALNQRDFDPSLGPAGRLEEELPESSAGGPGQEGEMHIPVAGIDDDPADGPTGRLEEALPESATGQPEEDLPESTTDPRGSLQEGPGPAPSMAEKPSVVSEKD